MLDTVFRERWDDPNSPDEDHPIAWIHDKLHHTRLHADPLPPQLPPPPECGPHIVQTLRTYPAIRPPYDFAPDGERSVARGYTKAIKRARRLIYLEDQYMWSAEVARLFADALRRHTPTCTWSSSCPASPTRTAPSPSGRSCVGRWQAIEMCRKAGQDRVHVFDVENHAGHAGLRAREGLRGRRRVGQRGQRQLQPPLVDPRQRAVQRGARHHPRPARAPRPGRHRRRRAHVRPRPAADPGPRAPGPAPTTAARTTTCSTPTGSSRRSPQRADALDAWHEGGRKGPRPPGRLRPHRAEQLPLFTRLWATPVYRLLDDPDGRPLRSCGCGRSF